MKGGVEMRINFNKNAKLHEICAIDELRDSMEYINFNPWKCILIKRTYYGNIQNI